LEGDVSVNRSKAVPRLPDSLAIARSPMFAN
jgi:hypothetical protein